MLLTQTYLKYAFKFCKRAAVGFTSLIADTLFASWHGAARCALTASRLRKK
jgi:hypothetical protein